MFAATLSRATRPPKPAGRPAWERSSQRVNQRFEFDWPFRRLSVSPRRRSSKAPTLAVSSQPKTMRPFHAAEVGGDLQVVAQRAQAAGLAGGERRAGSRTSRRACSSAACRRSPRGSAATRCTSRARRRSCSRPSAGGRCATGRRRSSFSSTERRSQPMAQSGASSVGAARRCRPGPVTSVNCRRSTIRQVLAVPLGQRAGVFGPVGRRVDEVVERLERVDRAGRVLRRCWPAPAAPGPCSRPCRASRAPAA